ncbi:MAG: DUF192 domain-containing protein [Candidatus Aenigmarchaeota archaeon]|nr:DUF192 domain-containing protein [Candidatus Aenigmarchaeota archaeon]
MPDKIKIILGNSKIEAFHFRTAFQLILGLMFRKDGNALLEFRKERKPKIWTLFMRYPLNLVFLDRNKKIVDLIEEVPPISFNPKTWKTYCPRKKCKYALELDARKRIKIDSKIEFI